VVQGSSRLLAPRRAPRARLGLTQQTMHLHVPNAIQDVLREALASHRAPHAQLARCHQVVLHRAQRVQLASSNLSLPDPRVHRVLVASSPQQDLVDALAVPRTSISRVVASQAACVAQQERATRALATLGAS